jgi:aromatic-amino-acid transaminase
MFEKLDMAPADPILGLSAAFKSDANPQKINLGVGVYQDANGKTPILESVKEAEKRILAQATSKSYLAIEGTPEYARAVQSLLLGAEHEILTSGRAVTVSPAPLPRRQNLAQPANLGQPCQDICRRWPSSAELYLL